MGVHAGGSTYGDFVRREFIFHGGAVESCATRQSGEEEGVDADVVAAVVHDVVRGGGDGGLAHAFFGAYDEVYGFLVGSACAVIRAGTCASHGG